MKRTCAHPCLHAATADQRQKRVREAESDIQEAEQIVRGQGVGLFELVLGRLNEAFAED